MSFTDPFHKLEEIIEDYSDVFDKDDWNAMLINEARTAINKLVAPSIIETISNSIQSERWFWNPTKNRGCIPGPGTEILDSIRMFVLNEIDNQLVTVGGVNSDNQVILYVPSSFYPLRGQALFTFYDNQNVEFRSHCCCDWARIQEASKAQIDCLAFHYPNHRFVVYGINSKCYSSYEQTANMMLFRETFIKQYSELFKKRTSKSLF